MHLTSWLTVKRYSFLLLLLFTFFLTVDGQCSRPRCCRRSPIRSYPIIYPQMFPLIYPSSKNKFFTINLGGGSLPSLPSIPSIPQFSGQIPQIPNFPPIPQFPGGIPGG